MHSTDFAQADKTVSTLPTSVLNQKPKKVKSEQQQKPKADVTLVFDSIKQLWHTPATSGVIRRGQIPRQSFILQLGFRVSAVGFKRVLPGGKHISLVEFFEAVQHLYITTEICRHAVI